MWIKHCPAVGFEFVRTHLWLIHRRTAATQKFHFNDTKVGKIKVWGNKRKISLYLCNALWWWIVGLSANATCFFMVGKRAKCLLQQQPIWRLSRGQSGEKEQGGGWGVASSHPELQRVWWNKRTFVYFLFFHYIHLRFSLQTTILY